MSHAAPRVAIVDDDDIIFKVYQTYLGDTFEVVTYNHPQKALDAIPGEKFDVIVSDLIMPDMDGIELIKNLEAKGVTTPIIIATGYADKQVALKALKAGAFSLIEKPIDGSELFFITQKAAVFYQLTSHNSKLLRFYNNFFSKLDVLESLLNHLSQFKPYIDELVREKEDLERLQSALKKAS